MTFQLCSADSTCRPPKVLHSVNRGGIPCNHLVINVPISSSNPPKLVFPSPVYFSEAILNWSRQAPHPQALGEIHSGWEIKEDGES